MSETEALIAAAKDNDLTARGALADWLDEHDIHVNTDLLRDPTRSIWIATNPLRIGGYIPDSFNWFVGAKYEQFGYYAVIESGHHSFIIAALSERRARLIGPVFRTRQDATQRVAELLERDPPAVGNVGA